MASLTAEKAPVCKKKVEKNLAVKEEYRLLSGIMGAMNNLRKQVNRRPLLSVFTPWSVELELDLGVCLTKAALCQVWIFMP